MNRRRQGRPTAARSLRTTHQERMLIFIQAIGSSPNALRMQKVVSFYEKLPRGAAPEVQAKGLLGRYQKRYFGKNASAMRMCPSTNIASLYQLKSDRMLTKYTALVHVIGALIALGYAQNYYFHLRMFHLLATLSIIRLTDLRPPQEQRTPLSGLYTLTDRIMSVADGGMCKYRV